MASFFPFFFVMFEQKDGGLLLSSKKLILNENKCLFSPSVLRERRRSLGSPSLHAVASLPVSFVPFPCSVKHGCSVLSPCAPARCSVSRKLAHRTGGTLPPHTDLQPWTWVHLNVPSLTLLPLALLLFYFVKCSVQRTLHTSDPRQLPLLFLFFRRQNVSRERRQVTHRSVRKLSLRPGSLCSQS